MPRDSNAHIVRIVAPGSSALATLANSMAVGTWAELTTTGLAGVLLVGGSTNNMIPFQNNGVWDPVRGLVHVVGQDHGWPAGLRQITYTESTNSWALVNGPGVGAHGYDSLEIDTTTGDLYMQSYVLGTNSAIYRKPQGGSWNLTYGIMNVYRNVAMGSVFWTGTLAGFSDPKGVWIVCEGDFGRIYAKGVSALGSAGNFTQLGGSLLNWTVGNYHQLGAYSRIKNVAVLGGGNGNGKKLFRVNADASVTALSQSIPVNIGIQQGSFFEDPGTTGNFLSMTQSQLWELNPDGSGTWTQQTGSRVPPAAVNTFDNTNQSCCVIPISTYGVTMVLSADGGSSANAYLYKHS